MPAPTLNWNPVEVRGVYADLAGNAINGEVWFTPTASRFVDGIAKTIVIGRTIKAQLTQGVLTVQLPAVDDPDVEPNEEWSYRVEEKFAEGTAGTTFFLRVPLASAPVGIDLAAAVAVPDVPVGEQAAFLAAIQEMIDAFSGSTGGGGGPHTHTTDGLTDVPALIKEFLQQASPSTARGAIGAGTSDLVLGLGEADAKPGNWLPTKAQVGLANVEDLTPDQMPISDAVQVALNATLQVGDADTDQVADTVMLRDAQGRSHVVAGTLPTHVVNLDQMEAAVEAAGAGGVAPAAWHKKLTANVDRTNTIAVADVVDLKQALAANKRYAIAGVLKVSDNGAAGNSVGDFELTIKGPAGATFDGAMLAPTAAATSASAQARFGSVGGLNPDGSAILNRTVVGGLVGGNTPIPVLVDIEVTMGANAGDVGFDFAQAVATAGLTTTLIKGGRLTITELP